MRYEIGAGRALRLVVCRSVGLLLCLLAGGASGSTVPQVLVLEGGGGRADRLIEELARRGVLSSKASLDDLAGTTSGAASRSLWIAADLAECRDTHAAAVTDHLKRGGGFLLLGDPPFQTILHPLGDSWVPQHQYLGSAISPDYPFPWAEREPDAFQIATDCPDASPTIAMEKLRLPSGTDSPVAHVQIPRLKGWTCFETSAPAEMPPGTITSFWAKGTSETYQLLVEWMEKDYSRWIAKVELKPEWQHYVLKPADFRFWYDGRSRGRGARGDSVRPENARQIGFGLALTHTPVGPGPHEFWISDVGVAQVKDPNVRRLLALEEIDGLYPHTSLYPVWPAAAEVSEPYQTSLTKEALPLPEKAWSAYWRPMGSGWGKGRRSRFIPVVTAMNSAGSRAGTLAAITLHFQDPYPGAVYGYVSISGDNLLFSPGWLDVIAGMAERMSSRAFFAEAGSPEFTYDLRDLQGGIFPVGARTVDLQLASTATAPRIRLRVTEQDGCPVADTSRPIASQGGGAFQALVTQPDDTSQTLRFRGELLAGDRLLDSIEQEIRFDGPRAKGNFVTARQRQFWRGRKPWRAFGINYMPTSGLALADPLTFEHWLENAAYDPAIVESDLERVADLGFNMISVFIYRRSADTGNLLDLLHRARARGLLVNLSLRPNEPPFPANPEVMTALVHGFRLAEKDEILAYDIAWEPYWGSETARFARGGAWRKWVEKKYGNRAAAEKKWGYRVTKLEEFPEADHLRYDGPWREAVADYRRYVQETLALAYGEARAQLRQLDPNHLVSFRQSEGANPMADPEQYPIPLECIAKAVDFYSPEGYGIGDSPEKARTLLFAASYGESLAPGKPMICAEYGASVWSGDSFTTRPLLQERQASVYRNILENADRARLAGTVAWWLAGGYRKYEESDFGVLNPDGTDRPAAAVIREYSARLKAPAPRVRWEPRLTARAGARVQGYVSVYEELEREFFDSVTSDTIPLVVWPGVSQKKGQ